MSTAQAIRPLALVDLERSAGDTPPERRISQDRRGEVADLAAADLDALGVAVRLVLTEGAALETAREILLEELAALDLACSRFRPDSELVSLNEAAGRAVVVSPLLAAAIGVGLEAARSTGGIVDPTLGASLVRLGYDRDFSALQPDGEPVPVSAWRGSAWDQVQLDPATRTVRLPAGVQLDLGATAKAWCADSAAARILAEVGGGVLVSLGGDIAVAGQAPEQGWAVRVQDRPGLPDVPADGPTTTVSISGGGLATSSTAARRWRRGGQVLHHLVDPRTGMPANSVWRTVTATAPTALAANIATTAAIVRSSAALAHLQRSGLAARLVDHDGAVTCVNGWPPEVDHGQR
jgi:thiamine biosynthesis lipoprotein ApbE